MALAIHFKDTTILDLATVDHMELYAPDEEYTAFLTNSNVIVVAVATSNIQYVQFS